MDIKYLRMQFANGIELNWIVVKKCTSQLEGYSFFLYLLSQSKNICVRLICDFKWCVNVNMLACFYSVWPHGGLAACPGCTLNPSWNGHPLQRVVEQQPEQRVKVTICHCHRSTRSHGAALRRQIWSDLWWQEEKEWSLKSDLWFDAAPFDGVSEWSSRVKSMTFKSWCGGSPTNDTDSAGFSL